MYLAALGGVSIPIRACARHFAILHFDFAARGMPRNLRGICYYADESIFSPTLRTKHVSFFFVFEIAFYFSSFFGDWRGASIGQKDGLEGENIFSKCSNDKVGSL